MSIIERVSNDGQGIFRNSSGEIIGVFNTDMGMWDGFPGKWFYVVGDLSDTNEEISPQMEGAVNCNLSIISDLEYIGYDYESVKDSQPMSNFRRLKLDQKICCIGQAVAYNLLGCVYLHPVQFNLVWREPEIGYDTILETFPEEIANETKNWDWDFVPFPHIKKLTVFSKQTGNEDERGGSCYNLNIKETDFTWSTKNRKGITLKDITEGVYRMKGSKYDWYYELFGGLVLDKIENDELTLEARFGYGS